MINPNYNAKKAIIEYLNYTSQENYDVMTAANLLENYFELIGRPEDFSLALVKFPRSSQTFSL